MKSYVIYVADSIIHSIDIYHALAICKALVYLINDEFHLRDF